MATGAIKPVIDYTSRDYQAIRADLIRLVQQRLPMWTASDPNDFGVALVEAVAYASDQLHYYLDRVAGEAYLETALQRESLTSIARLLGYTPSTALPSRVLLDFYNSSPADVVLPVGTRVQATVQTNDGSLVKSFETSQEVTVTGTPDNGAQSAVSVVATEGRTYKDEQVGVSSGLSFQRFLLPRYSVLTSTVQIETSLGEVDADWWQVDRLEDASDEDRAFTLEPQTDGAMAVVFGDGINGEVPALHAVIRATYRVGGGRVVVGANTVNTLVEPDIPNITVTNPQPSYGGRDAESLDSIRVRASRAFRSRQRAVTTYDFMALAASYSGIAKAKAVANNGTSVTVFAIGDDGAGDGRPELGEEAESNLRSYLTSIAMAGVDVTVVDCMWVPVYVTMNAHVLPGASRAQVQAEIESKLESLLGFANVGFDDRLSLSDITTALYGISGMSYFTVQGFGVDPDPRYLETLFFDSIYQGAVPYWDPANLDLTMVGGQ